jgi:hypothetical protein
MELALVYYVDLTGCRRFNEDDWYLATKLPQNLVDTQREFILKSIEEFKKKH